jgi:hypothetical protein
LCGVQVIPYLLFVYLELQLTPPLAGRPHGRGAPTAT